VFDANTVVSAALNPDGPPTRHRNRPDQGHHSPVGGRAQGSRGGSGETELRAGAHPDDRRREILELLSAAALWIAPGETVRDCRDGKDNRYLQLALAAGATAIVSGDEDLLVLNPWRGIQVLRPAQFLNEFRH
jgi:uncharacterized protein